MLFSSAPRGSGFDAAPHLVLVKRSMCGEPACGMLQKDGIRAMLMFPPALCSPSFSSPLHLHSALASRQWLHFDSVS